MKTNRHGDGERSLAVFLDFENIGIGLNSRRDRFDVNRVLERLVEKGKIVVKKAYADWSRFGQYTGPLHEAAIELIEIPKRSQTGKNSADIRMCVDAMDLAYSKDHIDTFVVVSGDSDFSPLVSKLKELGKHVIGLGLAEATSELLRDNCDEFIYYEDLDRPGSEMPEISSKIPEAKRKVFALLLESLLALRRENKEVLWSSMVKDTMKRKKPSFNEEYHGYRTFSELLEDAQQAGLLDLETHKTSGTYVVTRFGSEPHTGTRALPPAPPSANGGRHEPAEKRSAAPVAPPPAPPAATPARAPGKRTGARPPAGEAAPKPPAAKPPVARQAAKAAPPPAPATKAAPAPAPAVKSAPAVKAAPKPVEPPPEPKRRPTAAPPAASQPRRPAAKPNPPAEPKAKKSPPPADDKILDIVEGRHFDEPHEPNFGEGLDV